jgi:hypothetical protein
VLAEDTQQSADAYDLEEIVITALHRAESAFALSYMVVVQSMRELQDVRQVRTYRTLCERRLVQLRGRLSSSRAAPGRTETIRVATANYVTSSLEETPFSLKGAQNLVADRRLDHSTIRPH